MTRKRAKTIRIIEPPPPSSTNEIKCIELDESPPPPKKGAVTFELVEPSPPPKSEMRTATYELLQSTPNQSQELLCRSGSLKSCSCPIEEDQLMLLS